MGNRYYTKDQVRAELLKRLAGKRQADISRLCGAKPQHLSLMVNGAPVSGKVLAWLGFKKVEHLYEREK